MSATVKAIAFKLWSLYKAGLLGGASIPATSALLKGDGAGGVSAATAGTDYPGLATNNVFAAGVTLEIRTQGGGANDYVKIGPFGGINAQSNSVGGRWSLATINGYDGLWLGADAVVAWNSVANLNGGAKDTSLERSAAGWLSPAGGVYPSGSTPGGFELRQVASGGTPGTNAARIYAKDVSGTAEIFVLDEAGTETQISPHASDAPAWLYDLEDPMPHVLCDRNHYLGIARWTNFSRLVRLLSTGQAITNAPGLATTCVHVEAFEPRDWRADQAAKQAHYDADVLARLALAKKDLAHLAGIRPDQVTTAAAYATGQVPAPKDVRKGMPLWMQARFAALNDPREAVPEGEAKPAPAAGLFARLKGWLGLG